MGTRVPGVWAPADDGGPTVTEVVETLVGLQWQGGGDGVRWWKRQQWEEPQQTLCDPCLPLGILDPPLPRSGPASYI